MLWALLLLLFAALYLLSIDYVLIHLTLERMNDSTTVHKQFYTGRINIVCLFRVFLLRKLSIVYLFLVEVSQGRMLNPVENVLDVWLGLLYKTVTSSCNFYESTGNSPNNRNFLPLI